MRRASRAAAGLLLAAHALGACSLITEFDANKYSENTEVTCSDDMDNDGDGQTDCNDEGCKSLDFCKENSDARCSDNLDNDKDGKTDCSDPKCCPYASCYLEAACGESSAKACSDGLDNDKNGLTDCADFACKVKDCCRELLPVVSETFASGNPSCDIAPCASSKDACCSTVGTQCNMLSPQTWVSWGVPRPRIQDGKLVFNQPCTSCKVSGLISVADILLTPLLHLEATVNLAGESGSSVGIGLVDQVVIPQTDVPCGDVRSIFPFLLGIWVKPDQVQAVVGDKVQGYAPGNATGNTRVTISVDASGVMSFLLDGVVFYKTTAKLENPYSRVRLLLQGFSARATIDDVLVARREGCQSPEGWLSPPIGPSPVFTPSRESGTFDISSVSSPSVLFDGSTFRMYYTGSAITSPVTRIGHAVSSDGQVWSRVNSPLTVQGEPSNQLSHPCVIAMPDKSLLMAYRATPPVHIALASSRDGLSWTRLGTAVSLGKTGDWNEVDLSGPAMALFKGPADASARLYLWFIGQGTVTATSEANLLPSMGLVTTSWSADKGPGTFLPGAKNPVMRPQSGKNDDRGVTGPWIQVAGPLLRLWYVGRIWGGRSQINLAASEDGVNWVRYPGNPVVRSETPYIFGSKEMTAPTVVSRWGTLHMWYGGREPTGLQSVGYIQNHATAQ